jgi:[ribosomal protein S5]-alanine N-acetyltransferase
MLIISFNPFPTLHSERFVLRRLVRDDIPGLFNMRSDPEVMRFVPRPLCKTVEDAERVFNMMDERVEQNLGVNWAIGQRDAPDSFLGVLGIFRIDAEHHRGEIGYMLPRDNWGRGIVSELIPVAVAFGFTELGLHSIEAIIDPGNHASRRALEKNGFVQEAHFRENFYYEGQFLDAVHFSILKRDWLKNQGIPS